MDVEDAARGPGGGRAGPPELSALVDAARRGDRAALDELVRVTYSGTYTLAYRLTGHEDDARDVVQEAYLRAYRGLRRFRGDAQFTTWLYRITANCSANLLAKRARTSDRDPGRRRAGGGRPVRTTIPSCGWRARTSGPGSRRALAVLPWRLRQVIVLRDIYDLPHGSIATELGITEAAAKVRLHRARRRLRELLVRDQEEEAPGARAS